ncbi:hypothetical protein GCM10023201_11190 [Actinomycetospora corticicola]|uniref:Uncharacterized protein n=1 Tax=Actinomycetospora corticicola TaxID=663602 RepID=A0A7Y9DTB3_9PSEU|nr:hypothetical protein [Actinomycetospora corticicola]NYD35044.1 hypothetical protein [Actinomycetospora corticicola]
MGKHRVSIGRRGVAMLAATGALVIGGTSAVMFGTGSAAPLDILPISSPATTTYVLPDLDPFVKDDTRGDGKAEVSDEYGAPTGGGKAALRLSTPAGSDKVNYYATVSGADADLENWIAAGAYSAYQGAADNPVQFPSLQLTVDFNGPADGGYSNLTYEPVYNPGDSTTPGQWNRFLAGAGNWCSTRAIPGVIEEAQRGCSNGGAKPLADYVAAAPDLVVQRVVINQGSGNAGLESAVDLISTPTTTYDFELTKPTTPVDPTTPTTPPTTEPGQGGDNGGGHGHGNGGGNGNGHGTGGNNGNNGGGNGHCVCS